MKNRSTNINGSVVNWLKIKWLRFQKTKPCTIQYKYELQNELPFEELNVSGNNNQYLNWDLIELCPKYQSLIPISNAKKNDLLCLLKTGVIPNCYSAFINDIPASAKSKDVVPYYIEGEDDDDYFVPCDAKSSRLSRHRKESATKSTRSTANKKKTIK